MSMMTSRWLRVTEDKRARAYALTDHGTGVTHLRFAPPKVVDLVIVEYGDDLSPPNIVTEQPTPPPKRSA